MAANFQDVLRDVHNPSTHSLQTSDSGATIFAVVNTSAAGVGNSIVTINPRVDYIGLMSVSGNVNVGTPTVFIGTPTLYAVVNTGAAGVGNSIVTVANPNFGINAGVNGIGFATVNVAAIAAGNNNIGSVSVLGGVINANLNAGIAAVGFATVYNAIGTQFIGLVTVAPHALTASTINIGSVSVLGGSLVANLNTGTLNIGSVSVLGGEINANLNAGIAGIGFATVSNAIGTQFIGLVTVAPHALTASTINIGSVSVLGGTIGIGTGTLNIGSVSILGGTLKLADPNVFIGLATTVNGAGTQFIGLVTAWTRNAGTTKTLASNPFNLSAGSVATIAVPSTNAVMYVANLLINSDATVRVSIKSGVTYLTGNASIGIVLNPGGGWVENGSADSPVYIGNPSGALVVEKFDMTATKANIGGKVIWWTE